MKCDFCDLKATVFLTQLVEGQMKKVCLCDGCAKERGVTDPTGFSLADLLLGGLPGGPGTATTSASAMTPGNGKKCVTCGVGKGPEGLMAVQFRNQRIEELRSRLEQAITSESYEEAAGIRDEIRNLDEVKL